MRLQTKSQDRGSTRSPSRTASPGSLSRRPRAQAGQRRPARRSARRRGEHSAHSPLRRAQDHRSGLPERETPPIPLTLPGMQGAHRCSRRSSARSFFLLPLVLALLALAVFPVFAHAGGIPEYEVEKNETELPHSNTTVKPKSQGSQHHASPTNPPAEGSDVGGGKGSKSNSGSPEEKESERSSGGGGGSHSSGGGDHSGGGNPNSQSQSEGKISGAEKVATSSGKPASSSSGGGSSPIVPILIAVVVLAAISIGVVLYRQRKDGSGPDPRVSSPDAG
jgi:hypothetical protein